MSSTELGRGPLGAVVRGETRDVSPAGLAGPHDDGEKLMFYSMRSQWRILSWRVK